MRPKSIGSLLSVSVDQSCVFFSLKCLEVHLLLMYPAWSTALCRNVGCNIVLNGVNDVDHLTTCSILGWWLRMEPWQVTGCLDVIFLLLHKVYLYTYLCHSIMATLMMMKDCADGLLFVKTRGEHMAGYTELRLTYSPSVTAAYLS